MVNRLPSSYPPPSSQHLQRVVQENCDVSDARHSGVYSICTLVLKLRNLYKWEHHLEPWQESESAEVLAWIDQKERSWECIGEREFNLLPAGRKTLDPFATTAINHLLKDTDLYYGAGYGRSLKPIFFLTEKLAHLEVEGCPVFVLGREVARELSSPFAMLQDDTIIIRREILRYFLYDQITEISASAKETLGHSLSVYGLLDKRGALLPDRLREQLETIVDEELMAFIYHEVGEMQKRSSDREALQRLACFFPGSVQEYLTRAVLDVLADTAEPGMLSYIIRERKETSLGFYTALLDGMRQIIFPEIREAARSYFQTGDWEVIRRAVATGRRRNLERATLIRELGRNLEPRSACRIAADFEKKLLKPLGLTGTPQA